MLEGFYSLVIEGFNVADTTVLARTQSGRPQARRELLMLISVNKRKWGSLVQGWKKKKEARGTTRGLLTTSHDVST